MFKKFLLKLAQMRALFGGSPILDEPTFEFDACGLVPMSQSWSECAAAYSAQCGQSFNICFHCVDYLAPNVIQINLEDVTEETGLILCINVSKYWTADPNNERFLKWCGALVFFNVLFHVFWASEHYKEYREKILFVTRLYKGRLWDTDPTPAAVLVFGDQYNDYKRKSYRQYLLHQRQKGECCAY